MKRLLLRADDLGYSDGVNCGIAAAVQAGLIRSVGVMTNMRLQKAVWRACKSRISAWASTPISARVGPSAIPRSSRASLTMMAISSGAQHIAPPRGLGRTSWCLTRSLSKSRRSIGDSLSSSGVSPITSRDMRSQAPCSSAALRSLPSVTACPISRWVLRASQSPFARRRCFPMFPRISRHMKRIPLRRFERRLKRHRKGYAVSWCFTQVISTRTCEITRPMLEARIRGSRDACRP